MKNVAWVFLLLLPCSVFADELRLFTTDGCSAFPDGTSEQRSLWAECCIRHDLAYWMGGTSDERKQADQELKVCVAQVGEPDIAKLMLAGVRVGGHPYWPTPFRWGYGWPYPRSYGLLSESEKQQVKDRLKDFKLLVDTLSEEQK